MENFCVRLKKARANADMSQSQVAKMIGITVSGYASWEQGRTQPNIDMLKKLCQVLDVTSDYLLDL